MAYIYVYEPWPDAVDTLGLCGPLLQNSCKCTQEKNGDFRLDIDHPIDPAGKWTYLVPGNLIKADVPLRTLPQLGYLSTDPIATMRRATVKDVSASARAVYAGYNATALIRLATLKPGAVVYEVDYDNTGTYNYSRVRWASGDGWMLTDSLENFETITMTSPTIETLEQYIPSAPARPQLFRIWSTSISHDRITALARHVSYDNLQNVATYNVKSATALASVGGILSGTADQTVNNHVSVELKTDLTGTLDISPWIRVSPVEALQSPSNGVASYWTGESLRDNWTWLVLSRAGMNRGYQIAYGGNLLGVDYSVDMADIASQLLPVGQTSKGKPLVVPTNSYLIDGEYIVVVNGIITSPNHTYAVPHVSILDKGSEIKAAGTTTTQLNTAYKKLIRAALKKFADEECDLPSVTLKVDFLMLGDTAEYTQYKALDKLFLYDLVRVRDPRLGIDVTTEVNRIEWDCILGRYNSIELGSIRRDYARTRLATWQIPGLASLASYVDTISGLV